MLDVWQLERVFEEVPEDQRPVFNLLAMSIAEPRSRIVNWCQAHGIDALALLDTSEHKLRPGAAAASRTRTRRGDMMTPRGGARRGDAAGEGSRRRRGCRVDRPWWTSRGDAAAAAWIVRGPVAATPRLPRGSSEGGFAAGARPIGPELSGSLEQRRGKRRGGAARRGRVGANTPPGRDAAANRPLGISAAPAVPRPSESPRPPAAAVPRQPRPPGAEIEAFRALAKELSLDPPTIITRWALQRGIVAFPSLQRVVSEGSALTSAAKYEAWAEKLRKMLRARTLHLHSPTESRRVHLSDESMAMLSTLDREENEKQKRYADILAKRSHAKLKPVRAAANAIIAAKALTKGVSKSIISGAELEEKELEGAF